jgi:protein-disulfide isomerase
MTAEVGLGEETILALAESVGLDIEKLQADMADPEIDAELSNNFKLAEALAIEGTPGFVIGEDIVRGAIPLARLRGHIEKARAGAS